MSDAETKRRVPTLTVQERLLLMNALPEHGTLVTAKTVFYLRMKLAFTDAEQEALKFVEKDGQVRWNPEAAAELGEVGFMLTRREDKMAAEALEKMNKAETLTPQHVSLYEKFCGTEEESGTA